MPKERPILFSGPMVRAILEGRKTQTRRVIKVGNAYTYIGDYINDKGAFAQFVPKTYGMMGKEFKCPYGKPGDRLWVGEAWAQNPDFPGCKGNRFVCYKADPGHEYDGLKWKSPIHMPRWASRITLEVTDVRVERLQDINNTDAYSEGIVRVETTSPFDRFRTLWESINGPESWDANPWVWVVEFKPLEVPA